MGSTSRTTYSPSRAISGTPPPSPGLHGLHGLQEEPRPTPGRTGPIPQAGAGGMKGGAVGLVGMWGNPYRIGPTFFGAPTQVAFLGSEESRAGLPPGFLSAEPELWTWSFISGADPKSEVETFASEARAGEFHDIQSRNFRLGSSWRMKLPGLLLAGPVMHGSTNPTSPA